MVPPILATLTWLTEKEGGRKTPVKSGYRTVIRFPNKDGVKEYWSAMITFVGHEGWLCPGETANASLFFLSYHTVIEMLKVGMEIEVCEGHRCVAKGQVTAL